MPTANLNNAATQDQYVDALTVQFPFGRPAFTVQVFNAAVFYQLAIVDPSGRGATYEIGEHHLAPSAASFRDPVSEGFPSDTKFGGVRFRSAAVGVAARVTVA